MAQYNNVIEIKKDKAKEYSDALSLYDDGEHKQSLELAIDLIDRNFSHANTLAGAIYEEGGESVEKDINKSIFYYEKAIEEVGALEAWLALGRIYYFGKGVDRDYKKAFDCYAVVDEDAENGIASLMLGNFYLNGYSVEKDLSKAASYFKKAISLGNVYGYSGLALLESENGHILKSVLYRARAAASAFFLSMRDPNNPGLRQW